MKRASRTRKYRDLRSELDSDKQAYFEYVKNLEEQERKQEELRKKQEGQRKLELLNEQKIIAEQEEKIRIIENKKKEQEIKKEIIQDKTTTKKRSKYKIFILNELCNNTYFCLFNGCFNYYVEEGFR